MRERNLELIYGMSKNIVNGLKDESLYTNGQKRIILALKELNDAMNAVSIKPASTLDIIDRQECIAVKCWTDEDIENQAMGMGYEPSLSLINSVKRSGMLKILSECDDSDWNAISDAIKACAEPCNTEIFYTYTDADNYKQFQSIIIEGLITEAQEEKIKNCLDRKEFFIPSQLGMPEKRFDRLSSADHCWFSLDGFEHTASVKNIKITVKELVELFEDAKGKWDDTKFAMENPEIFEEE